MSRAAELRNQILKARQAYYFGGRPIMTDAEYDALEDELRELEPQDAVLSMVGAPLPPDGILTRARHRIPMGSQNKVNSAEEFVAWYLKSANGGAVHASVKGDGASAAAYYGAGRLERAISRGDGFEGEDITANAAKFKQLPVWCVDGSGAPFSGAVRFEVILTVEDWGKVDPERSKNPRNAGSGIMGRKNGEHSELLSCFAFDLEEQGRAFASEHQKVLRLKELGFGVVPERLCLTPEEGVAYYEEIKRTRDDLPFWIDGVVFKIDDIAQQASLGSTANRPKGQVAWKFDSKGKETTLLSYSVTVGHTGALIPTAQLHPVDIGGTTVSSALLNNWEEIRRLDVAVGDRVWVIKANDIIPKIVGVRERPAGRVPIALPSECPACGTKVQRRKNVSGAEGAILECPSDDCPAQSIGKIKRWIKALDIQGIGDSVRHALVEQLGLEDPSGLYRLHEQREAVENLVIHAEKDLRLGAKRTATILEEIERKRELSLVEFLGSLGIAGLGPRRVELVIASAGGELDTIAAWQAGLLRDPDFAARVGLPSVGPGIQDRIDAQADVIASLLASGVRIVRTGVTHDARPSELATICISGKLPSGKKKGDYEAPLLEKGYQLVDEVKKGLDLLVLADPDVVTGKAAKAKKYGVRIISEDELVALIS